MLMVTALIWGTAFVAQKSGMDLISPIAFNGIRTLVGSFAYCFACGSRPFTKPQHIITPHDLIDRAAALGVDAVQFGDNMPLEVYSDEELKQIRIHAEKCGVELEAGMRKATPERLSENNIVKNGKFMQHFDLL